MTASVEFAGRYRLSSERYQEYKALRENEPDQAKQWLANQVAGKDREDITRGLSVVVSPEQLKGGAICLTGRDYVGFSIKYLAPAQNRASADTPVEDLAVQYRSPEFSERTHQTAADHYYAANLHYTFTTIA
jgi:hypothetical protein